MGSPTVDTATPRYIAFFNTVKQKPNVTTVFIDYRDPIWSPGAYDLQWANNSRWSAREFAKLISPQNLNRVNADGTSNIAPIVSIGLTDNVTAFQTGLPVGDPNRGKYNEATAIAMMYDVANGRYDLDDANTGRHRVWPAILDAYRDNGFRTVYLRVGWEQNGNWYGWRVNSEATRLAYIAAWRHVADLAHTYAAANAMTVKTVWSPAASYANFGINEESSYPGDAYVDVIGPDAYDSIYNATRNADRSAFYDWTTRTSVTLAQWFDNPANRRHSWDYPSSDYWNKTRGWGMPSAIAFAMAHNKPFGLSETGTGAAGTTTQGGGIADDGEYPWYLAERLSPAIAQGLQLEFMNLWAVPTGSDNLDFLSGSRPLEAKAWKEVATNMAAIGSGANIALKKHVDVSTTEAGGFAGRAVDGDAVSMWTTSNNSAGQFIYVDLKQRYTVSRVKLSWDVLYAPAYKIQASNDATGWADVFVTNTANGGVDEIVGLSFSARYVRLEISGGQGARKYALRELEVYP
jgi:hypothetical protein